MKILKLIPHLTSPILGEEEEGNTPISGEGKAGKVFILGEEEEGNTPISGEEWELGLRL